MTIHVLRLFTDTYGVGESARTLPAQNRVLYVVTGSLMLRDRGIAASLDANSAWCSALPPAIVAGKSGARVLRWELTSAESEDASTTAACADSVLTLSQPIAMPASAVLMRCDRVDFPPGGEALTHVHQGPGIRCLLQGDIRIDALGQSHAYGPGEAWFEAGPDPVYAAASSGTPTGFARVMILPRSCQGKSSIRYVRPEDADKPKSQKYQIFADEFIEP